MSDITRIMKRVQQMYQERNKLFKESGLGDYTYSDAEIEKFIAEAVGKEITDKLEEMVGRL